MCLFRYASLYDENTGMCAGFFPVLHPLLYTIWLSNIFFSVSLFIVLKF